jgi:chromate transporter
LNAFLLYLILLKATMLSFSGLSSLPIVHDDLVVRRAVLTERELNTAVAVARMNPGPNGLYVVCVGYYVAGYAGAAAGYLAMVTPAFVVILMLKYLQQFKDDPKLDGAVEAVVSASSGLLLASTIPLGRDAIRGWETVVVALASLLVTAGTKLDTLWLILAAAAAGVVMHLLR